MTQYRAKTVFGSFAGILDVVIKRSRLIRSGDESNSHSLVPAYKNIGVEYKCLRDEQRTRVFKQRTRMKAHDTYISHVIIRLTPCNNYKTFYYAIVSICPPETFLL